jgi:hypothetical protein
MYCSIHCLLLNPRVFVHSNFFNSKILKAEKVSWIFDRPERRAANARRKETARIVCCGGWLVAVHLHGPFLDAPDLENDVYVYVVFLVSRKLCSPSAQRAAPCAKILAGRNASQPASEKQKRSL